MTLSYDVGIETLLTLREGEVLRLRDGASFPALYSYFVVGDVDVPAQVIHGEIIGVPDRIFAVPFVNLRQQATDVARWQGGLSRSLRPYRGS